MNEDKYVPSEEEISSAEESLTDAQKMHSAWRGREGDYKRFMEVAALELNTLEIEELLSSAKLIESNIGNTFKGDPYHHITLDFVLRGIEVETRMNESRPGSLKIEGIDVKGENFEKFFTKYGSMVKYLGSLLDRQEVAVRAIEKEQKAFEYEKEEEKKRDPESQERAKLAIEELLK